MIKISEQKGVVLYVSDTQACILDQTTIEHEGFAPYLVAFPVEMAKTTKAQLLKKIINKVMDAAGNTVQNEGAEAVKEIPPPMGGEGPTSKSEGNPGPLTLL